MENAAKHNVHNITAGNLATFFQEHMSGCTAEVSPTQYPVYLLLRVMFSKCCTDVYQRDESKAVHLSKLNSSVVSSK